MVSFTLCCDWFGTRATLSARCSNHKRHEGESQQILIALYLKRSHYSYMYFSGGIRCGELGGVMFGGDDISLENGHEQEDEKKELLRLAIPRRTYTESHMKYVFSTL